jgi:DNA-directed RNA polymerase specialized sigma24 family protein
MISDGIENCLQYAYNFDPEKSKNPFAYFTQIIYYAFIRRIQKEKKQLYIKYKTMEKNELLQDNIETEKHDKESRYGTTVLASDKKTKMYDFIDAFEQSKKKASKKKPTTSNSLFTDSNE